MRRSSRLPKVRLLGSSTGFNTPVSRLDGNICGDYVVTASFGGGAEIDGDLCYPRQSLVGKVTSDAAVALIYFEGSKYRLGCYFWCTSDGQLPPPPPNTTINAALVDRLVRITHTLHICSLCTLSIQLGERHNRSDDSLDAPEQRQTGLVLRVPGFHLPTFS